MSPSRKPGASTKAPRLSHLDGRGRARMVDVSGKGATARSAIARATVKVEATTLEHLLAGGVKKGNVLDVARVAGIQAAKRTWELIPLCHAVSLDSVRVDLEPAGRDRIEIEAEVRAHDRTGVEMEALVAAATAALTVYDMLKGVERGIVVTDLRVMEKKGGRSGTWRRG